MLKLKTFIRKTRRGKILKVVREHYLRDDLACGIAECKLCPDIIDEEVEKGVAPLSALDNHPTSACDLFPEAHFIVLVRGI